MNLANQVIDWLQLQRKLKKFKNIVIGISGGKDSTVVATLCVEAFGVEHVHGLLMPNGEQKDIQDSIDVCKFLNIAYDIKNIKSIYDAYIKLFPEIVNPNASVSDAAKTNLPARIRMGALYAYAQSHESTFVIGTCNRSEDIVGYATWGGDNFASLMPIAKLTTEEVIQMGLDMGIPEKFVKKTPVDGLQPLSDEEKLGFSYHEVNELIRQGKIGLNFTKILHMYECNKFKLDYLQIPSFQPLLPDAFDLHWFDNFFTSLA